MRAVSKPMVVAVVAALLALGCLVVVLVDSGGPQEGDRGATGRVGAAGQGGAAGATGAPGPAGATGRSGTAGLAGAAGPAGPQGPRGKAGQSGSQGKAGTAGPAGPAGETGPQGCAGPAGAAGPAGETGPQGCAGVAGPSGPAGSPGADGRTILSGSGPPSSKVGEDGDFYIDTSGDDIYGPKTGGDWGAATSTVGPEGPAGEQGPQGEPGVNGKTILSGAGAPDPGLGSDGDFYLDTSNNDFYGPKSGGSWGTGTSIVGPAGPQGIQGLPGPAGKTILSGPGAPLSDTGTDGDFYIDTLAEDIYGPKTGGAWGSPTSLVGPQGAKGDTGAQGPQGEKGDTGATGATGNGVLSGAGVPDPGLGRDGDFYIDTAALTIYGPKTGGGWGSPVSLVGPQGPQGDAGPAGDQGPKGDTGATGGTFPPAFGEFHSTGDQNPGAGGAVTPIVLNSTDESSGVTLDTTGGASITIAEGGTYNFQFSAQVTKTDGGTDVLYIWPQLNTGSGWSSPTWSNSSINLTAANQRQIPSWNFVFTVPDNTQFRMVMASTDTAFTVDSISPAPYGPEIPGLIVTANRVG